MGGHEGSGQKDGASPRAAAVNPEEAKGAEDVLESGESYTLEEGPLDRSHCLVRDPWVWAGRGFLTSLLLSPLLPSFPLSDSNWKPKARAPRSKPPLST